MLSILQHIQPSISAVHSVPVADMTHSVDDGHPSEHAKHPSRESVFLWHTEQPVYLGHAPFYKAYTLLHAKHLLVVPSNVKTGHPSGTFVHSSLKNVSSYVITVIY